MSLRNYTIIALPLFILHVLEEYLFNFINTDASIGWLSDLFDISRSNAYWTVQIIAGVFLVWLIFARPVSKIWYVVLDVFFIVEISHIWETIARGTYSPGFWTAIPLVVLGVLFWRELLTKKTS